MLVPVHTAAVFLSAALLFTLQPMIAKRLLPVLGGGPSVWNTAMLFFQVALLAGYAVAHLLSKRLAPRLRIAAHGVLLTAALPFLPLTLRAGDPPAGAASPVPWLLGAMVVSCGIPFLALSMTAPLLQHAFSRTDHPDAGDPYFLCAASNAGSLGGLLAYPFLIETTLSLRGQALGWSLLYVLAAMLAVAAGVAASRRPYPGGSSSLPATLGRRAGRGMVVPAPTEGRTPWKERGFWVLCAFVPSSLMIGITQALTTDVPPIPLLWVVPLAIYLGTFVLAFSRGWSPSVRGVGHGLAVVTVAYAASTILGRRFGAGVAIPLGLAMLAAAALLAHGRLASSRPPPARLTEFYLWIAFGGALGGVFNAIVAPVVFDRLTEVPIALTLALLLRPATGGDLAGRWRGLRAVLDIALPVAVVGTLLGTSPLSSQSLGVRVGTLFGIQAILPSAILLFAISRRVRFAAGVAAFLLAAEIEASVFSPVLLQRRTFYGIHRVVQIERSMRKIDDGGRERLVSMSSIALEHGSTRHGTQLLDANQRDIPTTYYHRSGSIGHVFEALGAGGRLREVALVGLGAGTLAAYGEQGRRFTVFEVDPAVIEIAQDPRLFTYVSRSRSPVTFVAGDGRLSLGRAEDSAFDLVVLDAFNSDAIPIHLLTREAFDTYFRKLAPGGVVACHLSNDSLDLVPVVESAALELGLSARVRFDEVETEQQFNEGKEPSVWAVLAREPATLAPLAWEAGWLPLPDPNRPGRRRPAWTDERSSLFQVVRLRR